MKNYGSKYSTEDRHYQQLVDGDGVVSVQSENLGTQVIRFTELGSYEHAGAGK